MENIDPHQFFHLSDNVHFVCSVRDFTPISDEYYRPMHFSAPGPISQYYCLATALGVAVESN